MNEMTPYIPGADNDLSMNFFLAKQSQNLEGLPSSVENTFSTKRAPISCLAWVRYCLNKSVLNKYNDLTACVYQTVALPASCCVVGFAYTELRGKPGSPGMSNLDIAKVYISF